MQEVGILCLTMDKGGGGCVRGTQSVLRGYVLWKEGPKCRLLKFSYFVTSAGKVMTWREKG